MPRMFIRVLGPLLFMFVLSLFILQMKSLQNTITIAKKDYQTDRVYSQQTYDADLNDMVSSGQIIGQIISSTQCNIEINSRIDGGWYKTTIKYLGEHAYVVCVTDQLNNTIYEEVLSNLDTFSASDFIGKGTYSVTKELKPNGEVSLLKYTYVTESEEYS